MIARMRVSIDTSIRRGTSAGPIANQSAKGRVGEGNAGGSGHQREQHALDEELPQQLTAGGAKRAADGDFVAPCRAAREKRFATFTQATSRTRPTAPSITNNIGRTLPKTTSCSASTLMLRALFTG